MSEDPLKILEKFCETLEHRIISRNHLPVNLEEQENLVEPAQGDHVNNSVNAALPHIEQGVVSSSTNAVLPDAEPEEIEMEPTQSFQ